MKLRFFLCGSYQSSSIKIQQSLPNTLNRRSILQTISISSFLAFPTIGLCKTKPGDWSSPGLSSDINEAAPKFEKVATGIRIQEVEGGSGNSAKPGDVVVVDYVLRRSNGYFIYSTVEGVSFQPRDVPVGPISFQIGDPSFIPGFSGSILGMKTGGRRRVVIPPELGYKTDVSLNPQPPNYAGKRQILNHANEPLLFEIALLKIRQ